MRVWVWLAVVLSGCATILRSTSEASPLPVLSCGEQVATDSAIGIDLMEKMLRRKEQMRWCVQGNAYDSVHGQYVFVFDIRPDGAVESVGVHHVKFASEPLAHCVADEIRRMRFAKSETGAKGVCFPFRF